ncbi:MAG: nucleoside phosphorylase [Ktedonobacterales bacterium]|nr:nucleoside phosphorylase [Ktedonobacterales bacterium]
MADEPPPPLLAPRDYAAPSVFTVAHLLAGARAQKHLPSAMVPPICLFDPDGDLVEYLRQTGQSIPDATWACYHTTLDRFAHAGHPYGIVGRVVGAPFAVMVAEELFASGCELLISITSAGQIVPLADPPYFVLIEEALRDEGTSYHYLPPAAFSAISPALRAALRAEWRQAQHPLRFGRSWTTDAPFRETAPLITQAHALGIAAVEMEAAALYALAMVQHRAIICFAHITNQLGQGDAEFEKGQANGSLAMLAIIAETTRIWHAAQAAESEYP